MMLPFPVIASQKSGHNGGATAMLFFLVKQLDHGKGVMVASLPSTLLLAHPQAKTKDTFKQLYKRIHT
ncbi:MAG: hypothetical protein JSU61_01250 [Fidelibacterota bacterium]|nr:MAG: hypothetical protein JSU61_01250 [Candidatus Neomarinimicrobiota bacterium]